MIEQQQMPGGDPSQPHKQGPGANAPEIIAAMLEVRRVRERVNSDYRETADAFKAKLRLLDQATAGLFEALDEAETGQLSLFDVNFSLPEGVEKILKHE